MKLIVTGATGFVGKEVVRLSLKQPDITAVVALSRTPLSMPQIQKMKEIYPSYEMSLLMIMKTIQTALQKSSLKLMRASNKGL